MKKLFYYHKWKLIVSILIPLLAICVFYSCSKGTKCFNDESYLTEIAKYDFIGKLHNEGLMYIHDAIKLKTKSGEITKDNITPEFLFELTKEYINGLDYPQSTKTIANKSINAIDIQILTKTKTDSPLSDLSPDAVILAEKILTAFDNYDEQFDSTIQSVEIEAIDILDETEEYAILAEASVARNTSEYWQQNFDSWLDSVSIETKTLDDIDWGEVGGSDAFGAITMAANMIASGTMAALIAAGPPGWTAIGLALAASAIVASSISLMFMIY